MLGKHSSCLFVALGGRVPHLALAHVAQSQVSCGTAKACQSGARQQTRRQLPALGLFIVTKRRKITRGAHAANGRDLGQAAGIQDGQHALDVDASDAAVTLAQHVDTKCQQASCPVLRQWRPHAYTYTHRDSEGDERVVVVFCATRSLGLYVCVCLFTGSVGANEIDL